MAAAGARTLSQIRTQSKKFVTTRNLSKKSEGGGSLIEVNLETDGENEILGMKRLEDAIYGIIVRRSAPDWLPFSPGSSYWVPPKKRPQGFAELIGKLANSFGNCGFQGRRTLTRLEFISITPQRSCEGPDNNILCNLFPDDTGTELPLTSPRRSK
ncbi:hypothetical protein MKX03_000629, partial [Papaver bracteatum]